MCKTTLMSAMLCLLVLFTGCAGKDKEIASDTGEQQIYKEAQRYLNSKSYSLAVRTLQLLESRYPFGRYAEQAQLELIYAHYGAYEREAAVEAAEGEADEPQGRQGADAPGPGLRPARRQASGGRGDGEARRGDRRVGQGPARLV